MEYFKNIATKTDKILSDQCEMWNAKMDQLPKDLLNYDEVCSTIRSTVGKANLLINAKGRFTQFRGLIKNCEFGLGEKETTCTDLQGFWEMIYFQVEDVEQKFKELEDLESKNWAIEKEVVKTATAQKPKPKKVVAKPPKAQSNLRQILAEKRKALMMKKNETEDKPVIIVTQDEKAKVNEEVVTFDAGFFNVVSSPKSPSPRGPSAIKKAFVTR